MQYNQSLELPNEPKGALICQSYLKKPDVFKNAIIKAAHNAGCEFLFEVPAELFNFDDCKAAAIKLNASHKHDPLLFILCNQQTGVINIVSNDEAPESVIRFVESYANVLSFLQNNGITQH